jgi:predicted phage-related endonuclease
MNTNPQEFDLMLDRAATIWLIEQAAVTKQSVELDEITKAQLAKFKTVDIPLEQLTTAARAIIDRLPDALGNYQLEVLKEMAANIKRVERMRTECVGLAKACMESASGCDVLIKRLRALMEQAA